MSLPTTAELNSKLDQIIRLQRTQLVLQGMELADLNAIVASETTDADLLALAAKLKATSDPLAADVAANTPKK